MMSCESPRTDSAVMDNTADFRFIVGLHPRACESFTKVLMQLDALRTQPLADVGFSGITRNMEPVVDWASLVVLPGLFMVAPSKNH